MLTFRWACWPQRDEKVITVTKQKIFINDMSLLRKSTMGWKILYIWKDNSTLWERLPDFKVPHLMQVSELTDVQGIVHEPTFNYHVLWIVSPYDCSSMWSFWTYNMCKASNFNKWKFWGTTHICNWLSMLLRGMVLLFVLMEINLINYFSCIQLCNLLLLQFCPLHCIVVLLKANSDDLLYYI